MNYSVVECNHFDDQYACFLASSPSQFRSIIHISGSYKELNNTEIKNAEGGLWTVSFEVSHVRLIYKMSSLFTD